MLDNLEDNLKDTVDFEEYNGDTKEFDDSELEESCELIFGFTDNMIKELPGYMIGKDQPILPYQSIDKLMQSVGMTNKSAEEGLDILSNYGNDAYIDFEKHRLGLD